MLPGFAQSIDRVTARRVKHIELSGLPQRSEGPINGRETNLASAVSYLLVELLRRTESARPSKSVNDRGPLAGPPRTHSRTRSAAMIPTPHPNARSWMTDLRGSGSLWISGMRSVLAM